VDSLMPSSRIPTPGAWGARRLNSAEERIRELQKHGPGPWVYVGTFPTDTLTTYWSPHWEHSFVHVTGRKVAFRWGLDGSLEFIGQLDLTAGAVTGTVAFTLPTDWRGETFDFPFPVFTGGTDWIAAVMSVDGDSGTCTVYWPVLADPI
jgi:hypothetical protein